MLRFPVNHLRKANQLRNGMAKNVVEDCLLKPNWTQSTRVVGSPIPDKSMDSSQVNGLFSVQWSLSMPKPSECLCHSVRL